MNEHRIAEAVKTITKRKAALAWLEEYGPKLGDTAEFVRVRVDLILAASCSGATEAQELLSSYGRFCMPKIVKDATECCRNDIAMATVAIREEIDKQPI